MEWTCHCWHHMLGIDFLIEVTWLMSSMLIEFWRERTGVIGRDRLVKKFELRQKLLARHYPTWSICCGAFGARPNHGRSAGHHWWSCSPWGCCRTSCWAPPFRCWSSPPGRIYRCRRTHRCPYTACHSAAPVACNHIMVLIWGIFTKIIMTVFVMSVKLMTMPGRVPCSDLSNKLVQLLSVFAHLEYQCIRCTNKKLVDLILDWGQLLVSVIVCYIQKSK